MTKTDLIEKIKEHYLLVLRGLEPDLALGGHSTRSAVSGRLGEVRN